MAKNNSCMLVWAPLRGKGEEEHQKLQMGDSSQLIVGHEALFISGREGVDWKSRGFSFSVEFLEEGAKKRGGGTYFQGLEENTPCAGAGDPSRQEGGPTHH